MKFSPNQFHNKIKQCTNFGKKRSCDPLIFKDKTVEHTNRELCQYFKGILCSQPPLSDTWSFIDKENFVSSPVDINFLLHQLSKLDVTSSEAPMEIPVFVYKEFSFLLAEPIKILMDMSFEQNVVPLQWKCNYLLPIPKLNSPEDPSQTRPICVSSPLVKICERVILHQLIVSSLPHIDKWQFGGIPGRSTAQYISIYIHRALQHLESHNTSVCSLFTDYSKAFDRVQYDILLEKMCKVGVPMNCILWVCSFLSDRSVVIKNGVSSQYPCPFEQTNGLPQGSVLGSYLYAIFTNEIAESIDTRLKYVDDLSVSLMINDNDFHQMQILANRINDQSELLHIPLNLSKCKILVHGFSRKLASNEERLVSINGYELESVDSIKMLGLIVQDNFKWSLQVNSMISSANKRMYMLYMLRKMGADLQTLRICYVTYIRPVIEYGAPVWNGAITVAQANDIEAVQRRASRIICGYYKMSYVDRLNCLGLVSLRQRRIVLSSSFAVKFAKSFPDLIPESRIQLTGRITRNSHKVQIPNIRTKRFKQSPLIKVYESLNS